MKEAMITPLATPETSRPDVDDMLEAGFPLWKAFALWNEMQGRPEPPAYWWARLKPSRPALQ
jgi:hypothetical protein